MASKQEIQVPDIGDFDGVSVIEVLVSVGDTVAVDQSLVTLESDKASMEVPSTHAGTVTEIKVEVGTEVTENMVIAVLETADSSADDAESAARDEAPDEGNKARDGSPADEASAEASEDGKAGHEQASDRGSNDRGSRAQPANDTDDDASIDDAYASPSVRRLARELEVTLGQVKGTGRKGRITRDDLTGHVKQALAGGGGSATAGGALPAMPTIDFSPFGEVDETPLSRIRQRSAENLHRSWLHVPHVTQFEDADITELEAFRKAHNARVAKTEAGAKLTPVPFVLKAAADALRAFPDVNASLGPNGDTLIRKRFIHIGVAVDTEDGLIVPVIRDVDRKGLEALAGELGDLAERARTKKLLPADLRGGTFTISSLGGIGGTAFTPIVNAPEVAILGLSRAVTRPVWQDDAFVPRLILPLSLSYDHRVVDGALAARFIVYLRDRLEDLRRLLL